MCRGVFDLLHVAHLRHLEEARAMGDLLIVSLTPDETAATEKRRPVIPENERREMLLGLRFVDAVDLRASWRDSILQWRPYLYVKGHDHKLTEAERFCCEANGVKVAFTKPNPQHTRAIIGRIKECA